MVLMTIFLVYQFQRQKANRQEMALKYVCKLFKGVSYPIHIFLVSELELILTHPSKEAFLPKSQSRKAQSPLTFKIYSPSILFPVFLPPMIIKESLLSTHTGKLTQGYVDTYKNSQKLAFKKVYFLKFISREDYLMMVMQSQDRLFRYQAFFLIGGSLFILKMKECCGQNQCNCLPFIYIFYPAIRAFTLYFLMSLPIFTLQCLSISIKYRRSYLFTITLSFKLYPYCNYSSPSPSFASITCYYCIFSCDQDTKSMRLSWIKASFFLVYFLPSSICFCCFFCLFFIIFLDLLFYIRLQQIAVKDQIQSHLAMHNPPPHHPQIKYPNKKRQALSIPSCTQPFKQPYLSIQLIYDRL